MPKLADHSYPHDHCQHYVDYFHPGYHRIKCDTSICIFFFQKYQNFSRFYHSMNFFPNNPKLRCTYLLPNTYVRATEPTKHTNFLEKSIKKFAPCTFGFNPICTPLIPDNSNLFNKNSKSRTPQASVVLE